MKLSYFFLCIHLKKKRKKRKKTHEQQFHSLLKNRRNKISLFYSAKKSPKFAESIDPCTFQTQSSSSITASTSMWSRNGHTMHFFTAHFQTQFLRYIFSSLHLLFPFLDSQRCPLPSCVRFDSKTLYRRRKMVTTRQFDTSFHHWSLNRWTLRITFESLR